MKIVDIENANRLLKESEELKQAVNNILQNNNLIISVMDENECIQYFNIGNENLQISISKLLEKRRSEILKEIEEL